MPITLYWTLMSQPSRAVKCLLEIAKIKAQLQEINLMANQTKSREYLNINPLGQIPFLVDGDFKLAESSAILVYLCEKYPENLASYYGKTAAERAKVNQFLSSYQSVYRPVVFKIIFLKVYKGLKRGRSIQLSEIKQAEIEMINTMKELQKVLEVSNTKFLTGNTPTIADLLYFFETTNFIIYEISLQKYKFVTNWLKRMQEIDEIKTIMDEWRSIAPGMTQMLKNIPIVNNMNNSKL